MPIVREHQKVRGVSATHDIVQSARSELGRTLFFCTRCPGRHLESMLGLERTRIVDQSNWK